MSDMPCDGCGYRGPACEDTGSLTLCHNCLAIVAAKAVDVLPAGHFAHLADLVLSRSELAASQN